MTELNSGSCTVAEACSEGRSWPVSGQPGKMGSDWPISIAQQWLCVRSTFQLVPAPRVICIAHKQRIVQCITGIAGLGNGPRTWMRSVCPCCETVPNHPHDCLDRVQTCWGMEGGDAQLIGVLTSENAFIERVGGHGMKILRGKKRPEEENPGG